MITISYQFLTHFFADCDPNQYTELFGIHPDQRLASYHVRIGDKTTLTKALTLAEVWNKEGYGIFFGVCPRNRDLTVPGKTTRGKESDVDTIVGFWTELDSVKEGRAPEDDLKRLQTSDMPPSAADLSGGGVHAFWLFDKPHKITDAERPVIKAILRGLGQHFGGDLQVAELARIMRVPGFANTKPGRNRAIVKLVQATKKIRYKLKDFDRFKPKPIERPRAPLPVTYQQTDQVELARLALEALSPSRWDKYGAMVGDEGWIAIGMCLHELGDVGLALWDEYSARHDKYKPGECAKHWKSFRGRKLGGLFWMAKEDKPDWRPERPKADNKAIAPVDPVQVVLDAPWQDGVPIMVRAAGNAYAPQASPVVYELCIEAIAKGYLKHDDCLTFARLQNASDKLGRGVSRRTLQRGLKEGIGVYWQKSEQVTNPHGVEFSTVVSLNCIGIGSGSTKSLEEAKGGFQGGKPADCYKLLPREQVLANLARASIMPILEKAFPADKGIVAPIRREFLEALGRPDAEKETAELETRYSDLLEKQPGYAYAIRQARREYVQLLRELSNPRSQAIHDGWTYANVAEYVSCCARSVLEASDGWLQETKKKLVRSIGCSERNLNTILKKAGIRVLKNQFKDAPLRLADVDKLDSKTYDKAMQGYPQAVVSSLDEIPHGLGKADLKDWCTTQVAQGATLMARFSQNNVQEIVYRSWFVALHFAQKVLSVLLKWATPLIVPLLPEAEPEIVKAQTEPVVPRLKPKKRILGRDAPTYSERWLKQLTGKVVPMMDKQELINPDGEVTPYSVPKAIDALLGKDAEDEVPPWGVMSMEDFARDILGGTYTVISEDAAAK